MQTPRWIFGSLFTCVALPKNITHNHQIQQSLYQHLYPILASQWSGISYSQRSCHFRVQNFTSSAAFKRWWDLFMGFVHSKLHNRLSRDQVKKLIFIKSN